MTKLTRKEHIARAMLLGMAYDWRDGTYCFYHIDDILTSLGMLDCDTLEPAEGNDLEDTMYDLRLRINNANKKYTDDGPTQPWEREDDGSQDT